MQFSTATVLAILASAASAAKLTNPTYGGIGEGKTFVITWTDASGPVDLTLKTGDSKDLKTLGPITTGATGGSFSWTPEKLPSGTYAIEIKDASGLNYSPQFQFTGTGTASSSAASSAASSTASTASSTSAAATTTSAAATSTTARPSSSSSTTGASNSTSSAPTSGAPRPSNLVNTNDSTKMYGSSLALVIVSVAALAFFN